MPAGGRSALRPAGSVVDGPRLGSGRYPVVIPVRISLTWYWVLAVLVVVSWPAVVVRVQVMVRDRG